MFGLGGPRQHWSQGGGQLGRNVGDQDTKRIDDELVVVAVAHEFSGELAVTDTNPLR